ncbi:leucine-rich repeat-containing protein 15-like [Anneissia japonica]|uniref:leucine-rich repeat-containing protein 15-like n=1 Tax=Anneissia japonica TaxID=1529436 RepID=UPI001425AB26|nr:leucine-rich repeat-containing protein 15-like [Anneissia japonica]
MRDISAKYNYIQSIDDAFEELTTLIRLTLDGNSIRVVKNTTFKDTMQLSFITMKNCSIEEIQPNTFTMLSGLSYLNIGDNNLVTIEEDMISLNGSSPCEILLNVLALTEIATGSFRNLGYSSSVYLQYNSIATIPPRVFQSRVLKNLDLSSNNLTHIHPEAFAELGSVAYVSLGNNRLTEIPLAVYSLKTEWFLILSLNYIDLSSQQNSSILAHSPKRLILSKNSIRFISKNYFCGLKTLQELFIYLNEISYIEDGSFSGTSLQTIYIYGNKLTKITSEMFNVQIGSLKYLYIFNNPIEDMEHGALSPFAPNSTVKCLTDKTQIKFHITNFNRDLTFYGMTCTTTTCEPCAPGFYGKLSGIGCNPCPQGGFYQEQRGHLKTGNYTTDCKRCPIGTFSPTLAATTIFGCRSCPTGTNTASQAALNACPCLENFHRTYRYGACQPCPSGVDCAVILP